MSKPEPEPEPEPEQESEYEPEPEPEPQLINKNLSGMLILLTSTAKVANLVYRPAVLQREEDTFQYCNG